MKRFRRKEIGGRESAYLQKRADDLAAKFDAPGSKSSLIDRHWASSRQTKTVGRVFDALKASTGEFERCMYCMDSHGCDIEHFIPKSDFHGVTYLWANMLLCCTECGRLKGSSLPVDESGILLANPMEEDPWAFLDFDPALGIITAAYSVDLGAYHPKGSETVKTLGLDRREALQAVYKRAYRRLSKVISDLVDIEIDAEDAVTRLEMEDDCGLAGWCFSNAARDISPMANLRASRQDIWELCIVKFH